MLFLDIAGYSKRLTDEQQALVDELNQVVRGSNEFQKAASADRLIKNGRAQFLRWNVHPRLSDVIALAEAARPKILIPAFCDRAQLPGLAQALAPVRVTMDPVVEF